MEEEKLKVCDYVKFSKKLHPYFTKGNGKHQLLMIQGKNYLVEGWEGDLPKNAILVGLNEKEYSFFKKNSHMISKKEI